MTASEYITPENAIAIAQTAASILVLKRIQKSHFWAVLGGLAAIELPLRVIDDKSNPVGRESFLAVTSVAYIVLVVLTRLLLVGARALGRAVAHATGLSRPEPSKAEAVARIEHYMSIHGPVSLEELFDVFGHHPEALFTVLAEAHQDQSFVDVTLSLQEGPDGVRSPYMHVAAQ